MAGDDHRRCTACGELTITKLRRFIGGWFFVRCPNCRSLLRVDPQHGQRWMLLAAFALIGAAAIAGAAVTDQPVAFVAFAALACALLYVWEFLLTRRAPLERVSAEEARGYKRHWALASAATLAASAAVAFLVTRL
jgi:drug/metabolite transporter (DMT)-like permease